MLVLLHPQGAELMADFFERCKADPDHWNRISKQGLERIYSR
jgi:sucrose synthase